ncbi:MAG: D-alanyl-D-alanine carboxypeptidase [Marinobacterium sp.]|nr:D-alanyl-D-alanine carboxypeptidase [Marinobacterium sp.]
MFKKIATPIYLLVAILFTVQVQAAPLIPSAPDIAARSWLVMDADTGQILAHKDADKRYPPASLTKMMTAYILEYELNKGNVSKNDLVLVSEKAWRTQGSRMFIREGTQVKLGDLMKGIIIQSGNDASVAVAEHIAGSESAFADLMNQHASLLGMNNSHFQNATGLPADNHYASAHDLAILAQAIIQRFPEHYGIYSEKYFTYNKIRQPNRNKLLWRDKTVDGLKTGFTSEAGYCLVASARRDDMRLISVVMGTKNENARAQESQKLLAYGFRYFRTHKLYAANEVLNSARVWGATKEQVALGLEQGLTVTIPRGQASKLQASLDVDKVIEGPVRKGQVFGTARVMLGDQLVAQQPLVALEDIEQAGIMTRIWHAILLFFVSLFG